MGEGGISYKPLAPISNFQPPCNTQGTQNEAFRECINVAGLVDLTALDRRGASEGPADRLGQGLRAVNDEEPWHRRVEPALTRLSMGLHGRGVLVAPSMRPSGCLSPLASTPIAATRIKSRPRECCRSGSPAGRAWTGQRPSTPACVRPRARPSRARPPTSTPRFPPSPERLPPAIVLHA